MIQPLHKLNIGVKRNLLKLVLRFSIVGMLALSTFALQAQDSEPLEIEVVITPAGDEDAPKEVVIEVNGKAPYQVMVYESLPTEDSRPIIQKTKEYNHLISLGELSDKNYYVMVQDADKRVGATSFSVK